ncbi:N-acetylmuramic acid 6-phosphate etherase [Synechococcus sp. RSCCF101]|nr:N-acetylmuramic acid 6-phosphate etherase [Synechococcus sp. RSCCF101]
MRRRLCTAACRRWPSRRPEGSARLGPRPGSSDARACAALRCRHRQRGHPFPGDRGAHGGAAVRGCRRRRALCRPSRGAGLPHPHGGGGGTQRNGGLLRAVGIRGSPGAPSLPAQHRRGAPDAGAATLQQGCERLEGGPGSGRVESGRRGDGGQGLLLRGARCAPAPAGGPAVSGPGADRGHLLTEQSNAASSDLDSMATADLVALFCREDRRPQEAVQAAAAELTRAIDAVAARLQAGGRLFYIGAGTSGRLGVLDAVECPPTFCSDPDQVQGVLAGGPPALLRSSEGLEDERQAGEEELRGRGLASSDALVGIAAGGTTPFVLGALEHGRSVGALTVALACVPREQAPMPCDIDIRLLTGPELLTGSTRLKAGTATKMALNILSTGVMVRLGKVHGNRMVDVAATNSKLLDRARRIVRDLAGVSGDEAGVALEAAGGSVKLALLMLASGLDRGAATEHLARHGPSLRVALEAASASLPIA